MENKFTQGQWKVTHDFTYKITDGWQLDMYKKDVSGPKDFQGNVATAIGNTKEEAEANAKLIASAPELLHQLQTAVEHIKNIQKKYKPENPFAIGGYEETIKKAQ